MLQVENLSVSYGETAVLRDVSLRVGERAVVCLMGRNGTGKTTLLKSIMGLLPAGSGRVRFCEKDLTRSSPDARARAGIGYVPQGREIFPHLTVLENLKIGAMAGATAFKPQERIQRSLDTFPALKPLLQRKGGVLSGGQQQQLAIARTLCAEPRLLILDEPTEGIQPSVISLIGRVLAQLKEQGRVAVLLVEQYFEFALKIADHCYVMEKGQIVMQGSTGELDKDAMKQYLAF